MASYLEKDVETNKNKMTLEGKNVYPVSQILNSISFFLRLVSFATLFDTDSMHRLDLAFPLGVSSNHTVCSPGIELPPS